MAKKNRHRPNAVYVGGIDIMNTACVWLVDDDERPAREPCAAAVQPVSRPVQGRPMPVLMGAAQCIAATVLSAFTKSQEMLTRR